MQILLANPRGFCAGVDRAIAIVERALDLLGAPVYVRHEVVHNRFVVERLRRLGAVFVDEVDEIPEGATAIFSAHGVSQAVRDKAVARDLTVFDATCPLVTKVHMEVKRYAREGREVVLIGHDGHPEVEGTLGQFDTRFGGAIYLVQSVQEARALRVNNPDFLAYVSQTTLSMDDTARIIAALRARFPSIHGPRKDDICYATQNRQDAVKTMIDRCDVLLVVGSRNSSNSNRLCEIGQQHGVHAHLIDGAEDIVPGWFDRCAVVGVTAGASAPDVLVERVLTRLGELGGERPEEISGKPENVTFSLPRALVAEHEPH